MRRPKVWSSISPSSFLFPLCGVAVFYLVPSSLAANSETTIHHASLATRPHRTINGPSMPSPWRVNSAPTLRVRRCHSNRAAICRHCNGLMRWHDNINVSSDVLVMRCLPPPPPVPSRPALLRWTRYTHLTLKQAMRISLCLKAC